MDSHQTQAALRAVITDQSLSVAKKSRHLRDIADCDEGEAAKYIKEAVEGVFHDGLGTYFEILVCNQLVQHYKIAQAEISAANAKGKMDHAIELYTALYPKDGVQVTLYKKEISNIEHASNLARAIISEKIGEQKAKSVEHTPTAYKNGLAQDVRITTDSGKSFSFSLKTDKSRKSALAGIGQTARVADLVQTLFQIDEVKFKKLLKDHFKTEEFDSLRDDFQKVCLLMQYCVIAGLALKGAIINNFTEAKFTDTALLRSFLTALRKAKGGNEGSDVLIASRKDGKLASGTKLDEIKLDGLALSDFSMRPSIPKKKNKYATELGIKYRGDVIVTIQTKHRRGKRPSQAFQDVTTRLIV